MKRIGIIDVGSNSARLVIMEITDSMGFQLVYNQKEPLRLAMKTDRSGNLTGEAFSSTAACLENFSFMCRLYKTDEIIAVATAAIRNAPNGAELAREVSERSGISLQVISGEEEAHLSCLGVLNSIDEKDAVIFDEGGGSTEIVLVKNREIVESASLPIGCVNLTEMGQQHGSESLKAMEKIIASEMKKTPWLENCGLPLIGVGGTARAVGKVEQKQLKYFTSKLHNFQFPAQDFRDWYKTLQGIPPEERRNIPGISEDRADVILAGASIINGLADKTKTRQFIISGCGLREGLFARFIHQQFPQKPLVTPDILKSSLENNLHLYAPDEPHARLVARIAGELFSGWHSLHHLETEKWMKPLQTAALLHDAGVRINFYNHTRHSGYLIENCRLFGLNHMDIVFSSIIAAWHHGVSRSYLKDKPYRKLLSEEDIQNLSTASLLLALAECLDYTQSGLVTDVRAEVSEGSAMLTVSASGEPVVELHQLNAMMPWIRRTLGSPLTVLVKAAATMQNAAGQARG